MRVVRLDWPLSGDAQRNVYHTGLSRDEAQTLRDDLDACYGNTAQTYVIEEE